LRRYGLLGEKLSHSFSPQIHKYFYDYPYSLFEVDPCMVEGFIKGDNFSAINVTIPYKKTVIPFCDELSETAKKVGSVNTLVKRSDKTLYGDNTDYYGFSYLAEKTGITFKNKKVVILGSGGSSLMVQTVARDKGAREIVVISRNGENNYSNISLHKDCDVLVNTTPVGMYPNNGASPLDLSVFENLSGVLDLIYNPSKTALILQAEEMGIPCANGLLMLVAQAKRAAEVFNDTEYEASLIEKIAADIEAETKNIILIGMPGCGKTSVAAALARISGRQVLDTDALILEKAGRTPSEIITEDGEDAFRRIETEVLAEVSKLSGKIIATGGGIVTREENLNLIKQNSTAVFLDRDISLLATDDRPLSQKEGTRALYEKRIHLYRKFADITVKSEDINKTAETIKEMLKI